LETSANKQTFENDSGGGMQNAFLHSFLKQKNAFPLYF